MDLGDDLRGLRRDGQQGDPAVALRVLADEFGQPAVVRPRTRHAEFGVLVAAQAEPHSEGRGGLAVDGVRVREDDLGRHSVAVELLEPLGGVPPALEALLVVAEPLVGEGFVAYAEPGHLLAAAALPGEEGVEVPVVTGLQIGPVPLGRQPGVAVGGNDEVGV